MAQYAIFLYSPPQKLEAPPATEPEERPDAGRSKYDRHSDELAISGAMVAAFALEPGWAATSLRETR